MAYPLAYIALPAVFEHVADRCLDIMEGDPTQERFGWGWMGRASHEDFAGHVSQLVTPELMRSSSSIHYLGRKNVERRFTDLHKV